MFRCLFRLVFLSLALLAFVLFIACQIFVLHACEEEIYGSVESVPAREVALVLGTTRLRHGGGENPYFKARIEAAVRLWRRGKVKHFLLTGDEENNEPRDMKKALIAHGVPAKALTLDGDGLRTLDSIVRAKNVFGFSKFTIVSQRDHDARALLIARYYGVDAIAFAAEDVPFRRGITAHIHEWFARVKVLLDLYILHTQPKHAGKAAA